MATHSLDVLQGVLDAPDAEVTVIRLRREDTVNHASVLPPQRVAELWTDPLIRFSNALDGVFHRGVVVCESDGDARFYDAALTAQRRSQGAAPSVNVTRSQCSRSGRTSVAKTMSVTAWKARAVSATVVAQPVAVASLSKALRKRRSRHVGDSARFVMTNFRGDRNVPIAEEILALLGRSESPRRSRACQPSPASSSSCSPPPCSPSLP
jgi:hypothetical protein